MTLSELIHEAIEKHPTMTDAALAGIVLHDRRATRAVLTPLVTDEVRRLRRTQTRRIEQHSFPRPSMVGESTLAERARLLRKTFSIPGTGRRVEWGKATVEDHRTRIAWIENHIGTLRETIARHEWAIKMIEEAGVTCLNEVPNEVSA
jgi:hypothetical protein